MALFQSGWKPLPRVLVLVEGAPVEAGQAVAVGREVRRHPVEDDADALLVEVVDEEHEVLGRAVAARRREVADRLVAPRPVEGVLHDRQELDVGEARLLDVVGEERGHLPVGQPAVALLGHAAPGAEVDLVDRDGAVEPVRAGPARHPVGVAPLVVEVPDDRGGARRGLGEEAERVGLLGDGAADLRGDVVLVERALAEARDEALPDARAVPAGPEGMAAGRPAVEVADDGDALGVRRPDGELRPRTAAGLHEVGAELVVELEVVAFFEEVDVAVRDPARPVDDVAGPGRRRSGLGGAFGSFAHGRLSLSFSVRGQPSL